ncbi:Manganese-transporting ATPase 4 [Grifola frondosa]|uniref:Manganese-transporting ATPase 4 n=1 Tax=Grifola frondosa TaxID=5627 RepID=A0A1C7MMV4_GRIFR|nr:Manganese-transporting ATPase 4 [Grifola frondosa]
MIKRQVSIKVESSEIAAASLHIALPWFTHIYTIPFLCLYPVLAYAYYVSFLVTRWSTGARAWITTRKANTLQQADCIRIVPAPHRGLGEIVPLVKKFHLPCCLLPLAISLFDLSSSCVISFPKGLQSGATADLISLYGKNEFDIPIPSFALLFGEHATAPFFVFQVFCVALWCLDEYWYYSLFTLFMLVVFECTVVWQRVRTLTEFRTMAVAPYPIQCMRDNKWTVIQTDELLPGDIISIVTRQHSETNIPADILLLQGTCIVNEAMLSGESTPLLKESIALLDDSENLDVDGNHKNAVLFSGTKLLQATNGGDTPDGGCPGVVLRTGFGTAQGQLVRTMIFSTERVSANNAESFLFIGFLLIFAIAASWYVWVKGIERELKKSKLLLDCILIITSVVPPELPMELSLAVNASLVALSKYAIFCTEPFRIPYAGRVDVCCFDKTGTITAENLVVEGVAGVDSTDRLKLVNVKESNKETTLSIAAAQALVRLSDGTIVGDPMERTTLDALSWELSKGDIVPILFRIETHVNNLDCVGGKTIVAAKGAPETIKTMLTDVPSFYDDTYKWYTRRGSRVLALGYKEMETLSSDKINKLSRDQVESHLSFAGFLVFHCPLKHDAVDTLKMLRNSSHRCVMITGDNPLTAAHVARDVDIVDREVLILEVQENSSNGSEEIVWRTVDEKYTLGYTTLMAGDGTNDVGALKQAHIGVALLDGTPEDLQKIAEHQKTERIKKVYESQLKISARFGQPPPPVPVAIAHLYPDVVDAQKKAAADLHNARKKNPMEKFDLASITDKLAEMESEDEVPKIKLGDASCAAPFTSKLSNVSAITHIIRQGRCTLVATIQMYKILALNCLITAYSLSVQYLDGIKFGDYQVTITGILMSVCFLCISRAKPFALHIASLVYITDLSRIYEERGPIDLEAKFEPNLLNTAIYLLSLSQQVSTFAINFQGRPFREGIRENSALYWGLVGASAVAFSGSTDFVPELNRWLQIVEMNASFKFKLTATMIIDFVGCWLIEVVCKHLFADLEPKAMITRGRERRKDLEADKKLQ